MSVLGELTIRSVGGTLNKEIPIIENGHHANENLDSVTLQRFSDIGFGVYPTY